MCSVNCVGIQFPGIVPNSNTKARNPGAGPWLDANTIGILHHPYPESPENHRIWSCDLPTHILRQTCGRILTIEAE